MRRLWVAALVFAAALAGGPGAGAYQPKYRDGRLEAQTRDASDSFAGLRASEGFAESSARMVQVAAHYPGSWTLYGSWVGGYTYACHGYAGSETLGGLIYNPHTVPQDPMPGYIHYPSWETAC